MPKEGYKQTKEHRKKISKNHARFWQGKKFSEVTKRKISEGITRAYDKKGRKPLQKYKRKFGKSGRKKGCRATKETRKKMSESAKRSWKEGNKNRNGGRKKGQQKGQRPKNWESLYTPEINEKRRIARLKQVLPTKNTSIELTVKKFLDDNNIKYVQQFNLGNKFQCDFYLPIANLIVECDGEYWHNREDMKKRDKAKNAYAKKCGFKMLRLPEKEIINNQFRSKVVSAIK